MSKFRIRIKFNPGRHGAPLDRFGEFTEQVEKFLRSLTTDLGLSVKKGQWVASNFKNGSVAFDSEYAGAIDDTQMVSGNNILNSLLGGNPAAAIGRGVLSYGTAAEFSKISKSIAPDEHFLIGLYSPNEEDSEEEPSEWKEVSYRRMSELKALLEAPLLSSGVIQGIIHAWHFGAEPPFFNVRELSMGRLIRCEYTSQEMYHKVHEATENEGAVVLVYGDMEWDKATNSIVRLSVTDIESTKSLTPKNFDALFGAVPEYTGSMTTDEYIEWVRGDED